MSRGKRGEKDGVNEFENGVREMAGGGRERERERNGGYGERREGDVK